MVRPVACLLELCYPLREEPRGVSRSHLGATSCLPIQDLRVQCSGGEDCSANSVDAMGGSDLPSPTRDLRPSLRRSRCSSSSRTTNSVGSRAMSSTKGRSDASCSSRNTKVSRAWLWRWLRPMCRTSM